MYGIKEGDMWNGWEIGTKEEEVKREEDNERE